MAKTYKLEPGVMKKILAGVAAPSKKYRDYFSILGTMIDTDVRITFRQEGQRGGRPKWHPFSEGTLRTPRGTWNIRYGTDLRGRPKGSYIPGQLRKGVRRYSPTSKLLQAGRGFSRSFGIRSITDRQLVYGTNHAKAEEIMRSPASRFHRPVLFVTAGDKERYAKRFKNWWLKGMKI